MSNEPWIPKEKGVYEPPPKDLYPNIMCRTVKISDHIARHISHFIGKDGRHFVEWTSKYKVLYIFYRNQEIEIWGENERQIHYLIHHIIERIKDINRRRQERFDKIQDSSESKGEVVQT